MVDLSYFLSVEGLFLTRICPASSHVMLLYLLPRQCLLCVMLISRKFQQFLKQCCEKAA